MSKTQRAAQRERRRAAERAAAATEARRRRIRLLAGAAGAAIVAVAIAIAVSSGGGEADDQPVTAGTASTLLAGIPETGGVLGDPDAPITVTEYVDLQCPICAEASKQTLPHIIDTYVRTGKVKLDARVLSFLGPDSVKAAQYAAAAEQQGKLWAFLETFYANQGTENSGYVTDDFLTDVATAAGVDPERAAAFAKTQDAQTALDTADGDAQTLGVDSTPTFAMNRDGTDQVVAVGLEDVQAKLDEALS